MFFEQAIAHQVPGYTREADSAHGESLAMLDYKDELKVKNDAIKEFWDVNRLAGNPQKVIASPMPREYRTTSKRRVFMQPGNLQFDRQDSMLEPEEHNKIYNLLFEKLITPAYKPLAYALNWIIIRGTYRYRVVIFNIKKIDATIVRKLKQISEVLQKSELNVTAAHAYVDTTESDYYLESKRPTEGLNFKQLYGPREMSLDLGHFRLKYPVTGFSQINESQIHNLIKAASRLLSLSKEDHFLDLYCGYGLFSFALGEAAKSVLGVEWEGPSIDCAKASAKHLKKSYRFIAGKIDEMFVQMRLPRPIPGEPEKILLDPPRKGCEPGVIHALAMRKPIRVCHVFCGTDEIPASLKEWERYGYRVREVQPLDLFPGTPHLETIVMLERK
ncbi:class I SAM-dependent RNA methyltransferase [Fibrobacter sp.]|uniref:class I SAM-dependent RNA methyltransferase n=1 Tax=Fibrobacter sp. TaxID=35828 RepID=UPI0025C0A114|nr:class I SAM-dependent RNA methyltransferase [Fibrobacter sp.]MCI6436834.1 class I SAM-dependent RNA methyltransferase [Fibrobacter sp.]MDD7496932.1 class I SAM-dependent RNA methyltransferase [Fibrobacter sp.]MDY5725127.1 class I SAM-dependent RNA methyltransferase [Fibrobacter sp.]